MKLTAQEIVKILKNAGHQAYWAGGCVRDILLGIEPKDFDIVTSAKPEDIEAIFENSIPIGKKFGIIMVIHNSHHYEIATFRSDSGYSDGRRPDYVEFSTAEKDAQRRDFTINGMFYDPIEDKIIDYVDGQKDLEAKIIRFIGDPENRIMEDHLRLLRAVRFKNQLDFQYEPATYQAVKNSAPLILDKVSKERVRDELNKMISDKTKPSMAFEDMSHLGILDLIFPELEKCRGVAQPFEYHQEGDVWAHIMSALDALPPEANLTLRWATLFHDIGKPETFKLEERIRFDSHAPVSGKIARQVMKRLCFSNKMIEDVAWCVEHHMMMVPLVEMNKGRQMSWFLNPQFENLLGVMEADAKGTTPSDLSLYQKIKNLYRLSIKKIKSIPKPLLSGNQIMEIANIPPSPEISQIKAELVELQLGKKIKTEAQAIKWLKQRNS